MTTALTATWHVNVTSNPIKINETTLLVGPGQDILSDVPKILAVAVWADNALAHRITLDSLTLADVQP